MSKFQVHYKENGNNKVVSKVFDDLPVLLSLEVLEDLADQGKTKMFEDVPRGNGAAIDKARVDNKLEKLGISDITVVEI